jgi:uncharacterized protein (TIGR04255 family)
VVVRGGEAPKKLKHDAITEAILEIRFDAPEGLPELFFARLCDTPEWKDFQQIRLPAYEIPASMRAMQTQLRFLPVLQLLDASDEAAPRIVRIGTQVLSYHRQRKYVGWEKFQPELELVVQNLFVAAPKVTISRLGLRYMNAFTAALHGIDAADALDLKASIADEPLRERMNLNYTRAVPGVGECAMRIATPDFVAGPLPDGTTVYVDVDVYTVGDVTEKSERDVKRWIVRAHEAEKDEFFHLLKPETIEALKEN